MTGLRDVARRAGVSVATASRVATGSSSVRPETRARVERAMRELLYVRPERRDPPRGLIGILVPEIGNPIFPTIAQAIEQRATAKGLASILCTTTGGPFHEADYVHMLLDRRVEGMIFVSGDLTNLHADHDHYARLADDRTGLVFVNGALHTLDVPCVGVDESAAGEIATKHLIGLGHRRIGFVAGPSHYLPTQLKAAGRAAALRAAGLEDAPGLVAHTDFSTTGGAAALERLLDQPEPPTGVICSSDVMAIGVLHAAARRGLHVPDDLSVVGFDGIAAGTWVLPGLTTVEQPVARIAETAVRTLEAVLADRDAPLPNSLFRPTLRVRGTTAAPQPAT